MGNRKILLIASIVVGFVLLLFIIPFLTIKKNLIGYYDQFGGVDGFGNEGWESVKAREPYALVLTEFSLLKPRYTLVQFIAVKESRDSGETDNFGIDANIYQYSRKNSLSWKWVIEKDTSNTVYNKTFEEVVELAKEVDISTLAETDKDISSYVPRTEEQERRLNEELEYLREYAQREDMRLNNLILNKFEERALALIYTDDQEAKNELYKEMAEFINSQEDISEEVRQKELDFYKGELRVE